MKNFSQDELRKMYDTPPQELTSMIHETIASLPYRETEEKIVKKKLSHVTVLAIVLILVLMATALAATSETVNGWLYERWPELAEILMPVNMTCEDQGFRLKVLSAVVQDNEVLVTYSVQDLEGGRFGPGAFTFIDFDIENNNSYGEGMYGESDSLTETRIYALRMQFNHEIAAKDGYITMYTNEIDLGTEPLTFIDLHPYLTQYGDQVSASSPPDNAYAGGPYDGTNLPENFRIIDWTRSLEIPLYDSAFLSGIGMIDGNLHVQFHNTNSRKTHFTYRACDSTGNILFSGEENDPNALSIIHWKDNPTDSDDTWEWVDYCFKIDPESAAKADLSAMFYHWKQPIEGNWEVRIPVRMIQRFDQAETDAA